jgi:hypothetical protein
MLPGRLANLSVRTPAGTGDATLIAGFALGGTASATATKPLLVRAVGPTLAAFGVENTLADPAITVAPLAASAPLATNDNWSGTAALKNAFASVGAFALTNDASRDAALLVSPPSGAYTATVSGGAGVALVEVYDTGTGLSPRLVNLSARTLARTGADALIAGFVIDGTLPKKILLRAAGPTLAAFGVGNTLADPVLTLRPLGSDNIVATNDDWAGTPALKAAFASVGAFVFAADSSRDAALMPRTPARRLHRHRIRKTKHHRRRPRRGLRTPVARVTAPRPHGSAASGTFRTRNRASRFLSASPPAQYASNTASFVKWIAV